MKPRKSRRGGWSPKAAWWTGALFDTCSLITLDKLFLDHPDLEPFFPSIHAIEESLSKDQMILETQARLLPRIHIRELPSLHATAQILKTAGLPVSLSEVDKLVYVTAVHCQHTVVTGDKPLARAVTRSGLRAGNIALILKALVGRRVLTVRECDEVLGNLAARKDFILPAWQAQTWDTLKTYTFP